MTRSQKRRLVFTCIRTVLLTALAASLDWGEYLVRPEHVIYDLRAAICQRNPPKPTDRLVHLDIDETSLSVIGRFPWSRDVQAQIFDEIRLAGPKVLALDMLYPEKTPITYDESGKPIDRDAIMAASFKRSGNVLVPCSLALREPPPTDAIEVELKSMLTLDAELSYEQCVAKLKQHGFGSLAEADDAAEKFRRMRSDAMYSRIDGEMAAGLTDRNQLHRKILPHSDVHTSSIQDRIFDEQYERVLGERAVLRFTIPPPINGVPVVKAVDEISPLKEFSDAAAYSGFVDYLPDHLGGTIRSLPLVASYRNRLIPHVGLAAACAMLDVDVKSLQLTANAVVIPRPNRTPIVIPITFRENAAVGAVGYLMEIPLYGKRDGWLTMYDYPKHVLPVQHYSVYEVWRICQTEERIKKNDEANDGVLKEVLQITDDPKVAEAYAKSPLRGDAKQAKIVETLKALKDLIDGLQGISSPDPDTKKLLDSYKTYDRLLREIIKQDRALAAQLVELRADLRQKLDGRTVFFGGTATSLFDLKPTSLDYACPGVVIHGAVFNAILTQTFWRRVDPRVTTLITIAIGLITGVLVSSLSPLRAFVATLILAIGYLALNGYILLDYYHLIVGAAGPILAAMLVWSGVTMTDYIIEIAERNRITRRFRSYVDPALVTWVLAHPEQGRFDGQVREMSMGFSDLAGFTSLTEKLREKAVPLLAEYMGRMIPPIRAQKGYVSKLMGDGIYFFFGAPVPNEHHAADAVAAVLGMHAALAEFNEELKSRGMPTLGMRIGVSTGSVVIGDAGPSDASDYTALGDPVNLASRLETANKVFGTKTLITARTVELLNGEYLVRPIANLRVAGKTEGVRVFEPLCKTADATPEQRRLVERTENIVNAFQRGDFAQCLAAAEEFERELGPAKLCSLYCKLGHEHLDHPPADFDGQVVLTEK